MPISGFVRLSSHISTTVDISTIRKPEACTSCGGDIRSVGWKCSELVCFLDGCDKELEYEYKE